MPSNTAHPDGRDVASDAVFATGTIERHHVYPVINNGQNGNYARGGDGKTPKPDSVRDAVSTPRHNARRMIARTCEHCRETFTLTTRQASKHAGRFCSLKCANAFRVGKPVPGFVTPDSDSRQRIAANGLVNKRLKLGWFEKPKRCMKCGLPRRLEAHHPDYAFPDQVFWLCRSDHMKVHHDPSHCAGITPFVCDDKRKAVARGA